MNKITINGQIKEIDIFYTYGGPLHKLEVNLSKNSILNLSIEAKENLTVNYQNYTVDFCSANLIQKGIVPKFNKFNFKNIAEYGKFNIKDIAALVEAPVKQQAREKYFKKYALDNGYDQSDNALIEYLKNDLLLTFIPVPLIGQKSLNLANTSEIYCDITILSNDYASEIIGDNFNSTTNIDSLEK